MSLTLRDAQHLCWKSFRKINDKLDSEHRGEQTPSAMATNLLEKAGKVAALINELGEPKSPENPKAKERLATELSYILYMVSILAEQYSIELEESFLQTMNDYVLGFI